MGDEGPYRELLLEHARKPRNFGRLAGARAFRGHNPLCGDELTLTLRFEAGVVSAAAFEGAGCALSIASASLMTEAIKGLDVAAARALRMRFVAAIGGGAIGGGAGDDLGALAPLASVRGFPARHRCVTLAWETLAEALDAPDDATGGDAV